MPRSTWIIWAVAFVWQAAHTGYFGWNLTAQSDAERLCDAIAVGLFVCGIVAAVQNIYARLRKLEESNG